MILKTDKIRLRFQGIKDETFKLLTIYFGFDLQQYTSKDEPIGTPPLILTPDFYNSRLNRSERNNLKTTQPPN
jgi:hypothetical protein